MVVHPATRRVSGMGAVAVVSVMLAAACHPMSQARAADDGKPATGSPNVLNSVLETLDVKTTVGPMPGFVEATHPDPATLRFLPTSTPHPKRAFPVKSADAVEAAKAALDAARDAQLKPRPAPSAKVQAKAKKTKPVRNAAAP